MERENARFRARIPIAKNNGSGIKRWLLGYGNQFMGQFTTYFFYDFPVDRSAKDLWYGFWSFEKVAYVYIPAHKDRQGSHFGFVQMAAVSDVKTRRGEEKEVTESAFDKEGIQLEKAKGAPKLVLEFFPIEDETAWLKKRGQQVVLLDNSEGCLEEFLNAWSERCFVELGGLIGEVILVDEDTRSKLFLCEGRVLILHKDKSKLHSIITLMVNGKGFPIMVMKHEWRVDPNWWLASERWSSMISESGSEYSDDSYGEADLNADGCLGDEGVTDAEDCTVMDEDSNWVLRRNANFEEGDSVDVFESSGLKKHGLVEGEVS
ncbi:hypothetical protein SLEP1_g58721 [Rubroshorea leprosula]|uniref:Uncharacterized protein n=1 Tax=Rubroshorea leprosula TaxID=152421 RepID=A0AAV5MTH3_9ROSI|nr:hypothetical protein SLEP1_g58721 [Rubroshorea leprosula]